MIHLVALATLLSAPPFGDPHPLVGVWKVAYPAGTRVENGEATVIKGTGTLTVALVGDSLVGQLAPDPIDGMPGRPATRMAAKAGPGPVVFVTRTTAKLNLNGVIQDATAISTWTLKASDDALEGTIDRKVEGFDTGAAGPQPVTGTRVKS